MIIDDAHKALAAGRIRHAAELFMALRHFPGEHPEARTGLDACAALSGSDICKPELDALFALPAIDDERARRMHGAATILQ